MSRTLRWPAAVITLTSPPGWYSYQIGVVSGARSGSAVTLRTPTYGSARKASRSSWVMGRTTERLYKPVKERVRELALRVVMAAQLREISPLWIQRADLVGVEELGAR